MTLKVAIQRDRPNGKGPFLPGTGLSLRHCSISTSSLSMRFPMMPSPPITRCDAFVWRFLRSKKSLVTHLGTRHYRGSHLHFRDPP